VGVAPEEAGGGVAREAVVTVAAGAYPKIHQTGRFPVPMPRGYRNVLPRRADPIATLSQDPSSRFPNPMFCPRHQPPAPRAGRTACGVRGSSPNRCCNETACGVRVTPSRVRSGGSPGYFDGRKVLLPTNMYLIVCSLSQSRVTNPART
jgi:hypothetical protein